MIKLGPNKAGVIHFIEHDNNRQMLLLVEILCNVWYDDNKIRLGSIFTACSIHDHLISNTIGNVR